MIPLTKEWTMNLPASKHIRLQRDPRELSTSDEEEGRSVQCFLQIARNTVAIDLPAHFLETHRQLGRDDEIVLRVPSGELARVEVRPILAKRQQQAANRWIAEMQDFDRF